jgi:D-glycero-beta-D-manno-heptose 1-phosphate adenylyltransferase
MNGIKTRVELILLRKKLRAEKKKVVFTNGVFDILHSGHVDYLTKSKALGDILLVGINSDNSVKKIKGNKRPILSEQERAFIIVNLKPVDYVTLFDEDTPQKLIEDIVPDVLIKGADWPLDKIVGKDIVEKNGGKVRTIEFVNQQSTSKIIELILERYEREND